MEWIEKERSYNTSKFDGEVIVSLLKKGRKTVTGFKFRKNSANKIVKSDSSAIVVAKDGSRIYFKEEDSSRGFKVRYQGKGIRYAYIPKKLVELDNVGEYNLIFDKETVLVYIDLNRKLEKSLDWFGKE